MNPWRWLGSPPAPTARDLGHEFDFDFDVMALLTVVLAAVWYGMIVFGCALVVGGTPAVGIAIIGVAAVNLLRMA